MRFSDPDTMCSHLIRGQRVASDEAWHFYEGDPLELFWIDDEDVVYREMLGRGASNVHPLMVWLPSCHRAVAAALGN